MGEIEENDIVLYGGGLFRVFLKTDKCLYLEVEDDPNDPFIVSPADVKLRAVGVEKHNRLIAEQEVSYHNIKENLDLALHVIKEQDKEIAELRSSRDSLSTMAKVYLERITALEAAINEAGEIQDG
jgi:hypothetical protein